MFLVLGLGNPGGRYARTRHNVGFLVADRLAERDGAVCDRKQLGALVAKARVGGEAALVAKPQGYMNESGQAAASLRGYYKLSNSDVVAVHDELELPFGEVRVKRGGGHGGHNGLRDLQKRLGGNDFFRVRVGIGRPPAGWDVADYVLADFSNDENVQLDELVDQAADAVEWLLADGLAAAAERLDQKHGAPAGGRARRAAR
jgi:PTH1 family peptidyl-tRNA hydrolase